MDPFSITVGVAGLASLAANVGQTIYRYIKTAQDSKQEIAALYAEVSTLHGLLQAVKHVASELESEQACGSTTRAVHVATCQQTLDKIKGLLKVKESKDLREGKFDSLKRKLAWPFSKPATMELVAEVKRHEDALKLALGADSITLLLKALSGQDETNHSILLLQAKVEQHFEATTRIQLDKERRKVLAFFSKVDPRANQHMGIKLRQPSTGVWLTEHEKFKSWLQTTNARLWLWGIAGAGKTILAASVIEEAIKRCNSNNAAAYFYCDYKNAPSQDPMNILGVIAQQLAKQDEEAYEFLAQFYDTHNPSEASSLPYTSEDLRDLILKIGTLFENVMVLVDGLDECGERMSEVTELLSDLSQTKSIKTLLLSRDEQDIRRFLGGDDQISIAAQSGDLRLYVFAEIEKRMHRGHLRIRDPSLQGEIAETLIKNADGMFRWVACQMDYLCEFTNDADRRAALKTLPKGLRPTYERILDRVLSSESSVQTLVQRSLRWISNANAILPSTALCHAVSIDDDALRLEHDKVPDVEEILRRCSSLVRKGQGNDILELAHFTVKEYLLSLEADSPYSMFRIHPDICDISMATTCLTYLCLSDFTTIDDFSEEAFEGRREKFPLRRYAAWGWSDHARAHLDNQTILSLAMKLLHPQKSPIFICWVQDMALHWSFKGEKFDDWAFEDVTRSSPLHWAAMLHLYEPCQWLINEGCEVQKGGPLGHPMHCAIAGVDILYMYGSLSLGLGQYCDKELSWEIVSTLIGAGADVNATFLHGEPDTGEQEKVSALALALYQGSPTVFSLLLEAKATLDDECVALINAIGVDHDVFEELFEAITEANLRDCDRSWWNEKTIVLRGLETNEFADPATHQAAFFSAARLGLTTRVAGLLESRHVDVNAVQDGDTALHIAASADECELAEMLISSGADLEKENGEGFTPLLKAVSSASQSTAARLTKNHHCNTNAVDHEGQTMWHFAAGNLELMDILQKASQSDVPVADICAQDGVTPLMEASRLGDAEALRWLLDRSKDPMKKDQAGLSALHHALFASGIPNLELLLEKGFDLHSLTKDGSNILHLAISAKDCEDLIAFLINRGVSVEAQRKDGKTALDLLCLRISQEPRHVITLPPGLRLLCQAQSATRPVFEGTSNSIGIICDSARSSPRFSNIVAATLDILLEFDIHTKHSLEVLFDRLVKQLADPFNDGYGISWIVKLIVKLVFKVPQAIILDAKGDNKRLLGLALRVRASDLVDILLDLTFDVDLRDSDLGECSALDLACTSGCEVSQFERILRSTANISGISSNGRQPIHRVCSNRSSDQALIFCRLLIAAGADCNAQYHDGATPLTEAVIAQNDDLVRYLIASGANLKLAGHDGWTVAHSACIQSRLETVEVLYEYDVCWNANVSNINLRTLGLHSEVKPLHLAVGACHLTIVDFLLQKRLVSSIDAETSDGLTALHIACANGNVDLVSILLRHGAKATATEASGLLTPLHVAARHGHRAVVEQLKSHGCDIGAEDQLGQNPGVHAFKAGFQDLANLLVSIEHTDDCEESSAIRASSWSPDGSSQGQVDRTPWTSNPVFLSRYSKTFVSAIKEGDLSFLTGQVSRGVNIDEAIGTQCSCTSLTYAMRWDKTDVAVFLIDNGCSLSGIACEESSRRGFNAFHFCLESGYTGVLSRLLERSSDLHRVMGAIHPLHLAVANGKTECLKMFLEHAKKSTTSQNLPATKYVPEDSPSGIGTFEDGVPPAPISLVDTMVSNPEWVWQVPKGFIADSNFFGGGPLHWAAHYSKLACAELLLEFGAAVDLPNSNLETALHVAAAYKPTNIPMIELLIASGASLNAQDDLMETPIMRAAQNDCAGAVELLEKHGADFELCNDLGQTVWYQMARSGSLEIAPRLWSSGSRLLSTDIKGQSVLSQAFQAFAATDVDLKKFVEGFTNIELEKALASLFSTHWYKTKEPLKKVIDTLPADVLCRVLQQPCIATESPLATAAMMGLPDIVDTLLDAGAPIDAHYAPHGSPLMTACAAGRSEVARLLVQRGAALSYEREGVLFSAIEKARYHKGVQTLLQEEIARRREKSGSPGRSDENGQDCPAIEGKAAIVNNSVAARPPASMPAEHAVLAQGSNPDHDDVCEILEPRTSRVDFQKPKLALINEKGSVNGAARKQMTDPKEVLINNANVNEKDEGERRNDSGSEAKVARTDSALSKRQAELAPKS